MIESGFWRTEIWHPLSVHFPIALLIAATFMRLIALGLHREKQSSWENPSRGLLLAGCITAWLAIYTGDMADALVSRKICDPTVLKDHELAAYNLAYLFSAAVLIDVINWFRLFKARFFALSRYLVILLMLVGSGYLVYAGHLGASLVYEQGAGVNQPPSDCSGYQ